MSDSDWDEEKTMFGRFDAKGEAHPDSEEPETESQRPKAIFRLAAIQHHLASERKGGPMPLVPLWAGVVTWTWVALIATAITIGSTLKVETTIQSIGTVQERAGLLATVSEGELGTAAVGDSVRIEVEGYPWSEYGSGTGRIIRMTAEGQPQEMVRVDITITGTPGGRPPRPGSQATVRFVTARRTPASILLAPILKQFR